MNVNTCIECGCINGSVGIVPTQMVGTMGLADTKIAGLVGVVNTQILGSVGIICTPNTEAYIKVTPEVLWFFNEHDVQYVDVISNIKWIVK